MKVLSSYAFGFVMCCVVWVMLFAFILHRALISKSSKGGIKNPCGSLLGCVHVPLVQNLLSNNPLFQGRDRTMEGM